MKKFLIGTLCMLLAASAFLPEAFAMAQGGGKYARFLNKDLKAQLKTAKEQRQQIPVMPRGLNAQQQAEFISNYDLAVQEAKQKGGSAGLQQAVRMWESMSESDKTQALSGRPVVGFYPAAIGAVMLAYIVARDLGKAAGKKELRSMSSAELNFIDGLKMEDFAAAADRRLAGVVPGSLDYSEGYAN